MNQETHTAASPRNRSVFTALSLACGLLAIPLFAGRSIAQDDFRAQAFAASKANDWPRAADLFFKLFKAGTDDQEALSTGAKCLEKSGRYNDALDILSRGAKKFPTEASFRVSLSRVFNLKAAQILRDSGKMDANVVFHYQDAIREAKAALQNWPANRDARLILANSHYSLGEWDKAKVQADELVKRFPDHPGGFIVLGDLAFEHHKLLRRRAAEKNADTSKEAMQKIVGSREAAKQSYKKAIEIDPKRLVAHRKLGDVYAWNAEVKKATEKYGQVLLIDPTANVSHDWITKTTSPAERFKFYEKLGKDYLQSKGADKRKAAVLVWYAAAALIADKKYQMGEDLYAYSIALNPDYTTGYYYAMYSAYFYRNDRLTALRHAGAYAQKAPIQFADIVRGLEFETRKQVTQLITFLAKDAMEKGVQAVSRDLNHVLAAIVDRADAWNNYAFMARESGQFDKSEAAYRHALEIEPGSGQLMNDLAVILHYHKPTPENLDEAEKLYRAAIVAAKKRLGDAKVDAKKKEVAKQTIQDATGNLKAMAELRKALKAEAKRKKKEKAAAERAAKKKARASRNGKR